MTSASTYLIDATGADPVLLQGDGYYYRGQGLPPYKGQSGPPYPGQPGPPYQGPPGLPYQGQSGPSYQGPPGPPFQYKGVQEVDELYHPPPSQLNGRAAHCNHMNDGCECFRENYSINRKVRSLIIHIHSSSRST